MYGSKVAMCRNAHTLNGEYVGVSKIGNYENPYTVTGCIKHTGSKQEPKGIMYRQNLLERGRLWTCEISN